MQIQPKKEQSARPGLPENMKSPEMAKPGDPQSNSAAPKPTQPP
jgi:hypothetical protein